MTAPTVHRTVAWVDGRATTFSAVHARPAVSFMERLADAVTSSSVVADVACGTGTIALAVAPRVRRVIAVDVDENVVRFAARRAAERCLKNVVCYQSDLEQEPWTAWLPETGVDVVTMHLFASQAAVRHTAAALKPGGTLVVAALAPDHWQETGRPSRFAVAAQDLVAWCTDAGLEPGPLVHDVSFVNAPSFEVLAQTFFEGARHPMVARWQEDGRWAGLEAAFARGALGLTESRFVVAARRPH